MEIKKPKDLGVKIGTKVEAFWTDVLKNVEAAIENSKNEILLNSELRSIAKRKILEEQEKNKTEVKTDGK